MVIFVISGGNGLGIGFQSIDIDGVRWLNLRRTEGACAERSIALSVVEAVSRAKPRGVEALKC